MVWLLPPPCGPVSTSISTVHFFLFTSLSLAPMATMAVTVLLVLRDDDLGWFDKG